MPRGAICKEQGLPDDYHDATEIQASSTCRWGAQTTNRSPRHRRIWYKAIQNTSSIKEVVEHLPFAVFDDLWSISSHKIDSKVIGNFDGKLQNMGYGGKHGTAIKYLCLFLSTTKCAVLGEFPCYAE